MSEPAPPAHGDVTGEYLALRRESGLVQPGRDVVWVEGPDAVSFADGLLSQDLAGMEPGTVRRSFLLEPRGKLRAVSWVLAGEGRIALALDPGLGTGVARELERFLFRVEVAVRTDESVAWELWGPGSAAVLAEAGFGMADGWTVSDRGLVAYLPMGAFPRYLVVGGSADAAAAAGARAVGRIAAESVRIEAGEPVMGVDVDETTIPQETGLVEEAVSFTKGCFLGQELVARIDARGHVNRFLRGLIVADNVIPPAGADVVAAGREAGRVTSVGESLELRAPVCLATVHGAVEPGSDVQVRWKGGSAAATVHALPLADFSEG